MGVSVGVYVTCGKYHQSMYVLIRITYRVDNGKNQTSPSSPLTSRRDELIKCIRVHTSDAILCENLSSTSHILSEAPLACVAKLNCKVGALLRLSAHLSLGDPYIPEVCSFKSETRAPFQDVAQLYGS